MSALAQLLAGRRAVVLTGAGCSTESGIPDYRGEGTRRRFWARSAIGWERFRDAQPNAGHRALAALQAAGAVRALITQNVDRLHAKAGSREVIELHGALADVACLRCGHGEPRHELQARLLDANPGWLESATEIQPDGGCPRRGSRGCPIRCCTPRR